jgi:hypothetical protein
VLTSVPEITRMIAPSKIGKSGTGRRGAAPAPIVCWGRRPAAFILSGEMAVAYFMTRPPRGFFPLLNGGESEVFFYCFAFLYLAFAGAGPWSIDPLWRRRSLSV